MAKINSVIVLAPNGRRQTVKVTPNSTVLQVLEEVCKKHEFDPQEYDIRHHSRVLDTTMTLQFSRLPNNAQLEMVKAKKIRRESEVLVSVQVESGSRLSGSFLPSDSLWDVITKLCSDIDVAGKQPSVLYMRQEICGVANLKSTTLRSLGLTSGRALLRFMNKFTEGDAPQQSVANEMNTVTVTSISQQKDSPMDVDLDGSENKAATEPIEFSRSPVDHKSHLANEQSNSEVSMNESADHERSDKSSSNQHSPSEDKVSVTKKLHTETESMTVDSLNSEKSSPQPSDIESMKSSSLEEILSAEIEPRDRNAVVFRRGVQRTSTGEDLPDEFFELTLDDVRYLYRDLKHKITEVDESPLQTKAVRKLEESKKILNNLHKYKRAVLRIQFPDLTVLQGSFSPVETIQNVQDFVRGYLQDPSVSFHLFTTPPKTILSPTDRLIEANCVPCAVLHFGLNTDGEENISYLRLDVLSQLSSVEIASAAATQSRGIHSASQVTHTAPSTSGIQQSIPSTSGIQQPTPSTSGSESSKGHEKNSNLPSSSKGENKHTGNPNGKVPKWFKMAPK